MALFSFGKKDKNPPETPASVAKAPPSPPKIQNPPVPGTTPAVKPPQPAGLIPTSGMTGRSATTQPMVMPRGPGGGLKPARPGVAQSTRSTQRIILPPSAPNAKPSSTKPLSMATPTGRINLPVGMILRCLPPEVLANDLSEFEASGKAATEIGLPLNMILSQLPSGKVEISLQDLVPHFPAGYLQPTESIASYLPTLVNLPLMDVVMRIPPDLLSLRPDQKDVDAAVINMADPFTEEILREQAEAARQAAQAPQANIIEESQVPGAPQAEEFIPRDQQAKSFVPPPRVPGNTLPIPSVTQRPPSVVLPPYPIPAPAAAAPTPPMPPAQQLPTPSAVRPASPVPPSSPNTSSRTISPSGRLPAPTRATTPIPTRPPVPPTTPAPVQSSLSQVTAPMPPPPRPTSPAPVPPVPRQTSSVPAPVAPRPTSSVPVPPVPRQTSSVPAPPLPPQAAFTPAVPVAPAPALSVSAPPAPPAPRPVAPPPPQSGFSRRAPTGPIPPPPMPPALAPQASPVQVPPPTPPAAAPEIPSAPLEVLAGTETEPLSAPGAPAPEAQSGAGDLARLASLAMEQMGEGSGSEATKSSAPEPAEAQTIAIPSAPVFEVPAPVTSAKPEAPLVSEPAPQPGVPAPIVAEAPKPESQPQPADAPQAQPLHEQPANVALNLNNCVAEELLQIPGITREVAAAIVAHRKRLGSFGKLEDLLGVPGMNKTIYTNLTGEAPPAGDVPQSLNELLGFPEEQTVTLKDVTDRIACWPDVTGCVLSQNSGLSLVGKVPAGLDKTAIVAFVPRMFEAVNKSFGEITGKETDELSIPTSGTSFHILRNKDLFLIILSRFPQLPERSMKVARFVLAGLSIRQN